MAEEVGNLNVRITGDESGLKKALESAGIDIAEFGAKADEALKKADEAVKEFEKETKQAMNEAEKEAEKLSENIKLTVAAGFAFAANEARKFGAEAVAAFREGETAQVGLEATLRANGRQVTVTAAQYQQFADRLQSTANVADNTTKNMLKMAETMGLTGEKAKQAVEHAVALGAIKGADPESFIRATVALEQGNSAMIAAKLGLKGIKDEGERTDKVMKALAAGMEQVGANMETSAGKAKALDLAMGKFKEGVGAILDKALSPLNVILKAVVDTMNAIGPIAYAATTAFGVAAVAAGTLSAALASVKVQALLAGAALALAEAAAIGFLAAIGVGILVAIGLALKALWDWATDAKRANDEMERSAKLTQELSDLTAKRTKSILDQADAQESSADRERMLHEELERTEQALADQQKVMDNLKDKMKDLTTPGRDVRGVPQALADESRIAELKQELSDVEAQFKGNTEQAEALRAKLQEIADAKDKVTKAGRALVAQMEEEKRMRETGMSKEEITAEKLEAAGADPKVVQQIRELAEAEKDFADELKKAKEADAELKKQQAKDDAHKKVIDNLREQIETLGMTSKELLLYRLRKEGASQADIEAAEKAMDELEQKKKLQEAQREGKRLLEQAETPEEKFARHMEKLNDLLRMGGINQEEFNKLQEKARTDRDKALAKADKGKSSDIIQGDKTARTVSVFSPEALADSLHPTVLGGGPGSFKNDNIPKQQLDKLIDVDTTLKDIRGLTEEQARKPVVNIRSAGIA